MFKNIWYAILIGVTLISYSQNSVSMEASPKESWKEYLLGQSITLCPKPKNYLELLPQDLHKQIIKYHPNPKEMNKTEFDKFVNYVKASKINKSKELMKYIIDRCKVPAEYKLSLLIKFRTPFATACSVIAKDCKNIPEFVKSFYLKPLSTFSGGICALGLAAWLGYTAKRYPMIEKIGINRFMPTDFLNWKQAEEFLQTPTNNIFIYSSVAHMSGIQTFNAKYRYSFLVFIGGIISLMHTFKD